MFQIVADFDAKASRNTRWQAVMGVLGWACDQTATVTPRLRTGSVAAYHLWADRFGNTGAGRARDIDNVHSWHPTHATYIGTYQNAGITYLAKSDFISFYDFAWKRGPQINPPDLPAAWSTAQANDNRLGRYRATDAGLPGKGNFNRLLYTQTTSIACGLRAAMWHIGSRIMNMNDFQLNQHMTLKLVRAGKPRVFDRSTRAYLPAAVRNGAFSFKLDPAGAAIVLFD